VATGVVYTVEMCAVSSACVSTHSVPAGAHPREGHLRAGDRSPVPLRICVHVCVKEATFHMLCLRIAVRTHTGHMRCVHVQEQRAREA